MPELMQFYTGYQDFHAPCETLKINARRNIKLLSDYGLTKKKRLLDYGCGRNLFVTVGKTDKWRGYDPFVLGLDSCPVSSYDFLTLWGVLEHLHDPETYMKCIRGLLKNKGHIALTTVSTETGMPYRHKPPEHLTYWTEKSLRLLFQKVGLKVIAYEPYFMVQQADVYLRCVFDAAKVPMHLRKQLAWRGKQTVLVPTNEVLVIGKV